jgi:hypothetical protein
MINLKEEKLKVPLGRKGNVIEPIMTGFCKLQMIYWPYHLLYFWINSNEIIPFEYMNGWWCSLVLRIGIKFGRLCIAYNSIFVALIRYIYIVHNQKSSLWEFSKVSRYFRVASIAVPLTMEIVGFFILDYQELWYLTEFKDCVSFFSGSNTTATMHIPTPYGLAWTLQIIPESIVSVAWYIYLCITVVIYLNVAEGFLYFQIYRSIKRYIYKTTHKTIIIY